MEIKCINAENYKLTAGNVYLAEDDSRDFYKLINDNGVGVRYAKRLFEPADQVQEEVVIPARTEQDLINSIRIENHQVVFNNFENEATIINDQFEENGSSISCGIEQVEGINPQIQEIDSLFNLEEDDFIAIRKELFKRCILQYVKVPLNENQRVMALLSTNMTGEDDGHEADTEMLSVLDNLASTKTPQMRNPNSGRDIKLWVITQ